MPRSADQQFPPEKGPPPPRDWPRLARYAARAVFELARARIAFASISMREIQALNAAHNGGEIPESADVLIGWIAYAVPRAAHRMPFRADCLVQALAAQRWLAAHGIGSSVVIGAERPDGQPFAAHAWLECGGRTVTGGETTQYTILL